MIVGPCNCAKTYLMVNRNISSEYNKPDRKKEISIRSLNQYPHYDTEEKVSVTDDYKECVVAFDVMLGKKRKDVSPSFTRGNHENIDVLYFAPDIVTANI